MSVTPVSPVTLEPCQYPTTYIRTHAAVTAVHHSRDCTGDLLDDGATSTVSASGTPSKHSEFKNTDVIEVNGISTSFDGQKKQAKALSAIVGQPVTAIHVGTTGSQAGDVAEGAFPDKLGFQSLGEKHLVTAIKSDLDHGKDAHIVAHSRGALVTERALEALVAEYKSEGVGDTDLYRKLSHVSVETFGGAAKSFPNGVQNVDYVSDADPIGSTWGKGHPNTWTQNILEHIDGRGEGAHDASFVANSIHTVFSLGEHVLGMSASIEGVATRAVSSGLDDTVVRIPSRTATNAHASRAEISEASRNDPIGTLNANHSFDWYLQHRVSYQDALDDAPSLTAKGDAIEAP